jgi:hypothetical protein
MTPLHCAGCARRSCTFLEVARSMPKPYRLELPPRRGINDAETASYLGRSPTSFAEHRPELEAAGFPKPLPLVGTRDRKAVDLWLDAQGGLAAVLRDFDTAWMEAAGNGQV